MMYFAKYVLSINLTFVVGDLSPSEALKCLVEGDCQTRNLFNSDSLPYQQLTALLSLLHLNSMGEGILQLLHMGNH